MPGLATSNEFISRDEGLHCDFACFMLNTYIKDFDIEKATQIIFEACEIEKIFVRESLKDDLLGYLYIYKRNQSKFNV